jgi:predicted ribosome quality control (RQC) complex YloA/Tae2 family protein
MKDAMSNTDIMMVLPEIKRAAEGAFVKNIYLHGQVFVLKLYQPSGGNSQLLIEPGRRIHLTELRRVAQKQPTKFVTVLRKYLRDKRIVSVRQHGLDRIAVIEAGDESGTYKLVAELFGEGNLVLLDPQDAIFVAMHYKRMRDRDLVPKAKYELPPPRGIDVFALEGQSLKETMSDSKANVVRTLASRLNLDALCCEEICALSTVPSTVMAANLDDQAFQNLENGLHSFIEKLKAGVEGPCLVFEETEEAGKESAPLAFLPFKFAFYHGLQTKPFETFSQAIDEFFGISPLEDAEEETSEKLTEERHRLQTIIDRQQESFLLLRSKSEELRRTGELIYSNFQVVQETLESITGARSRGQSWDQIVRKIEDGKKEGVKSAALIDRIIPSEAQIVMTLGGIPVALDVRLSAQDNASASYDQAKKMEAKAEGAESQIEKTRSQLTQTQATTEPRAPKAITSKVRKKKWYERYRWFLSSEGFLVLGGRDMKSNEQLAKRQMTANDIFLHASLHGAPYVIIKVPEQPPGEQTLHEAAQFAVAFSSAWQDGLSSGDAFWVNPEQVSFTPPTGEYLPPGGVMLYGTKNYIRGVPVEISVGVVIEGDFAMPISGPTSAVSTNTNCHVRIVPGKTKKSQLVKEIVGHLVRMASEESAPLITRIPQEDMMQVLPPGDGEILL